jgi:hypothetical protein
MSTHLVEPKGVKAELAHTALPAARPELSRVVVALDDADGLDLFGFGVSGIGV